MADFQEQIRKLEDRYQRGDISFAEYVDLRRGLEQKQGGSGESFKRDFNPEGRTQLSGPLSAFESSPESAPQPGAEGEDSSWIPDWLRDFSFSGVDISREDMRPFVHGMSSVVPGLGFAGNRIIDRLYPEAEEERTPFSPSGASQDEIALFNALTQGGRGSMGAGGGIGMEGIPEPGTSVNEFTVPGIGPAPDVPQRQIPSSGEELGEVIRNAFRETKPEPFGISDLFQGTSEGLLQVDPTADFGTQLLAAGAGAGRSRERSEEAQRNYLQKMAEIETRIAETELERQDLQEQVEYQNKVAKFEQDQAIRAAAQPKLTPVTGGFIISSQQPDGGLKVKQYTQTDLRDTIDLMNAREELAGSFGIGGTDKLRIAGDVVNKDEVPAGLWSPTVLAWSTYNAGLDFQVDENLGFREANLNRVAQEFGFEDVQGLREAYQAGRIEPEMLETEFIRQAVINLSNNPDWMSAGIRSYLTQVGISQNPGNFERIMEESSENE